MHGPRHDLKYVSIEWRQEAAAVGSAGAVWMHVIEVFTCAKNSEELMKVHAPGCPPRFVGCEITRVQVRQFSLAAERAKVAAAAQVSSWVCNWRPLVWTFRRRQEVWVAGTDVLSLRPAAMATVAIHLRIDQVAAQSDQPSISVFVIERNRGDGKADLDLAVVLIMIWFTVGTYARSFEGDE